MNPPLPVVRALRAADGTERLLVALADGEHIETVVMPHASAQRMTICVSTQVGCPVRCRFCASGLDGFGRNLTADEITAQVASAAARAPLPAQTRIVFMGAGEPLLNVEALCGALREIRARWAIGRKHMRVSTVGIARGLARLAAEPYPPGLALSLHAVRDDLRRWLIPFAAAGTVTEAIDRALAYAHAARVRVAIQYVLLGGVNDGIDDAARLRDLLRDAPVKVDLIEWNPVADTPFRASDAETGDTFARTLYEAGIHVTRRRSRGVEAEAACGQLRRSGGCGTAHDSVAPPAAERPR